MSSPEQKKCNQCLFAFSEVRKALRMPGCKHNICEQCLQQIRDAKLDVIQCQFCDASAVKIQGKKFEPNRLLMVKIRDSKAQQVEKSSETSVSINGQQDELCNPNQFLLTQDEISLPKPAPSICPDHEKPYQIICVTDLKMICPHCAIFGNHKDHSFKTIKQFNNDYEHRYEKVQMIKQLRYGCEKKLKGLKERDYIEGLIGDRKAMLRAEVKGIFQRLIKEVEDLEVAVCEELNRNFSAVYKDITALLEQESKLDQQYTKWQSECQNMLDLIDTNQSVNTKIETLYGPLAKVSQGQDLVDKLEKKYQLQTKKIGNLVGSVSVEVKDGLDLSKFVRVNRRVQDPKKDNFVQMLEKLNLPSGKHVLDDLDFNDNSFLGDYQKEQDSFVSESGIKRVPSRSVMSKRNPPTSSRAAPATTQKFRSPNKKPPAQKTTNDSVLINRCKSNTEIKISELLSNTSSPNLFQTSMIKMETRDAETVVNDFINHDLKQVLDLSRCQLNDQLLLTLIRKVRKARKIRGLKLCQNYITDTGFQSIIDHLGSTTNMNISYNKLTEQSLSLIIKYRDKLSPLRIVNMSFNAVNQKKGRTRIQALRKMGVIVNI